MFRSPNIGRSSLFGDSPLPWAQEEENDMRNVRHRPTTMQKLNDVYGDKLTDMGLLSARKLSNIHAKNSSVSQQMEQRLLRAQKSTTQLIGSGNPGRHTLDDVDLSKRSSDMVKLLITWDKHQLRLQQLRSPPPGPAASASAMRAAGSSLEAGISGNSIHEPGSIGADPSDSALSASTVGSWRSWLTRKPGRSRAAAAAAAAADPQQQQGSPQVTDAGTGGSGEENAPSAQSSAWRLMQRMASQPSQQTLDAQESKQRVAQSIIDQLSAQDELSLVSIARSRQSKSSSHSNTGGHGKQRASSSSHHALSGNPSQASIGNSHSRASLPTVHSGGSAAQQQQQQQTHHRRAHLAPGGSGSGSSWLPPLDHQASAAGSGGADDGDDDGELDAPPTTAPAPAPPRPDAADMTLALVEMLTSGGGILQGQAPLESARGEYEVGGRKVTVYTGVYGNARQWEDDSRKRMEAIAKSNPAGFVESAAASEVASYREAAERGRLVLEYTQMLPSDPAGTRALRGSVQELHYRRPYFVVPPITPDRPVKLPRDAAEPLEGEEVEEEEWDPATCIFAPRMVESDAQAMVDTDLVRARQLAKDWRRIRGKERFKRFLLSEDPGAKTGEVSLEKVLEALHAVLAEHAGWLSTAFAYYCMLGTHMGDSTYTIAGNEWRLMLSDCSIMDPASRWCKPEHCDTIFISTNYEEDSRTLESKINMDDKLMKFEFYEALIRVAGAKYVKTGQMNSMAEAFRTLLEQDIKPRLSAEAQHDATPYRWSRLYVRETDKELRKHVPVLQAVFNLFAAKGKGTRTLVRLEDWLGVLETYGLLGDHTGVSKREAKLIFSWSQMTVVDEFQRRMRVCSMDFLDFLEGLARVADLMSPPPREELPKLLSTELQVPEDDVPAIMAAHPYYTYYSKILTDNKSGSIKPRASARLSAPKTQPLAAKVAALMDYLMQALHVAWETTHDPDRLLTKMNAMTKLLSESRNI